jgi:hypothetical protein
MRNPDVDGWFEAKQHPMEEAMQVVRRVTLRPIPASRSRSNGRHRRTRTRGTSSASTRRRSSSACCFTPGRKSPGTTRPWRATPRLHGSCGSRMRRTSSAGPASSSRSCARGVSGRTSPRPERIAWSRGWASQPYVGLDRRLALGERSWDPGRWVGEGRGTGPGPHGARRKIYVLEILLSHIDQPRDHKCNPRPGSMPQASRGSV